jgi:hypothetical protein
LSEDQNLSRNNQDGKAVGVRVKVRVRVRVRVRVNDRVLLFSETVPTFVALKVREGLG